jgi:malate synthase
MTKVAERIQVTSKPVGATDAILAEEALEFLTELHDRFDPTREALLARRAERQREINSGRLPDFLPDTAEIRGGSWQVAPAPADLQDRRVEITGPTERKMMINAFNSGAKVFMADFEDSLSPTWTNVIDGQQNLVDAVRRNLDFTSPEGKQYKLNDQIATLVVRPRGWHLPENHIVIDGKPMSASLCDFGLFFFHNAKELVGRGSGPYFYLPKMESHLEARLWNDVFNFAQDYVGIPRGTIRATVLIETILAAFEMEEILYELRDHAAGLNAGRWDYIFSLIKKLGTQPQFVLPDRGQVTMTVPFMRAYAKLLVYSCHKHGAHAMGGMAAFIPSRKDAEVNKIALAKVTEDKLREANDGFDGTWVAHPDLVSIAIKEFDNVLGKKPNQKDRPLEKLNITAKDLLTTDIEGGKITKAGVTGNIDVAIQYIDSWLRGVGAAAIHNLMEDAATAEIARAQLWQWIRSGAKLDDGQPVTKDLYITIRDELVAKFQQQDPSGNNRFAQAASILDQLVLNEQFVEFLTLPAYQILSEIS